MTYRISRLLFLLFLTSASCLSGYAQDIPNKNWSAEKIKGTRFYPYATYNGYPFLNDRWVPGKVEFADGEISDTLNIRYSSFKDDLVYYNKNNTTQIVIDKASLRGFSFTGNDGRQRVFRKQFYDGFWKGDRFFEVLSDKKIALLAYRKVNLNSTWAYRDGNGILKNMEYAPEYTFYFYSPDKGYSSVKISRASLLSKFDPTLQKSIKKLLRKKRIRIDGEDSFIQAWEAIQNEGYQVIF